MTTRRAFLMQVGQVGGFGAAYVMMQSLGLLPLPEAAASKVRLAEGSGRGKRVVILGAGIAGMVAAWELQKAGYSCTILEARGRAGGRNWTIRNGTRVEMTDGTTQTCTFEDGHYFNAGPARLPSQHVTMLGYCREFGVQLEVEVNSSRSSLLQNDKFNDGKAVQQRQVINDTRGHVAELLAKSIKRGALDEDLFDMQATMFQPVGGMDRIAAAFEKKLSHGIRFDASVEQIRKTPKGVRIGYRDRKTGMAAAIEADCCICAMPLSILKTIDTDFSPEFKQAIDAASYDSAYKIAWESRRFWERDYRIYGGISFPKQIVGVVWYPSANLFAEKGIIVAGYSIENGTEFANLDLAGKLAASRQAVEHLHPGCSSDLAKPVYVSWGHIPYNLGSWISHGGPKGSAVGFDRLLEPDGPIYMAGDHMSHIVGWQEGAALSAHRAVSQINQISGV